MKLRIKTNKKIYAIKNNISIIATHRQINTSVYAINDINLMQYSIK